MIANDKQVGGDHYKSTFQHWDFAGYLQLPGHPWQITRYVSRWRSKGGVKDLEKALHHTDKMIEVEAVRRIKYVTLLEQFIDVHKLNAHEQVVFNSLVAFQLGDDQCLTAARKAISDMILIAKKNPPAVTPEDPTFRENRDEWKTA